MRQAIITKYIGPTDNNYNSRIKATAYGGSKTIIWNDALSVEDNHREAALALATKMGWLEHNKLIGGGSPEESGYVFVQVDK